MKTTALRFALGIAIAILFTACAPKETTMQLVSPDDKLLIQFWLTESGEPRYSVQHSGLVILEASALGLEGTGIGRFDSDLSLIEASAIERIEDRYTMHQGKALERHYVSNQQVFTLVNAEGEQLQIRFRVSDDGLGFRYHLPEPKTETVTIERELTTFKFPSNTRKGATPMAEVNTGWAETNPSYEEHYVAPVDVGTPSPIGFGWSYPALFKVEETWALLTEVGMDGSYPGTRLRTLSEDGLYGIGFADSLEVITDGIRGPEFQTPWSSPWRVLAIGGLDTLIESTLGTDLAYPAAFEADDYVQSGRVSWSWAKLKDDSVNFEESIEFIDFAADMGWEYTLIDAGWDTRIGYDHIAELADYAGSKGVGLWLWYNSAGDWNSTYQTPRDRMLNREQRRAEFQRIQEMGIRGIKVDFFPGDGQSVMQYYIDILEDAHAHKLMVNFHGCTLPRGWQRTYPNLMTMESVMGFEFITFDQANADAAPRHIAMLPFTRNVFDPMDFTPMSLDRIPNIERRTTSANELAQSVVFLSGVQNYAETPAGLAPVPDFVKDFARKVPAAWDETRFIDGYPGRFAVIARRHGDGWFVAGVNGEPEARSLELQLPFIDSNMRGYRIGDGEGLYDYEHQNLDLNPGDTVELTLQANGGFVLFLSHP